MCRVIRFQDVLPRVIQPSVAKQEAVTAILQVDLVIFLDAIRNKGHASAVEFAMPFRSVPAHALGERQINLCVGKRLGLSVVPSPARKCD